MRKYRSIGLSCLALFIGFDSSSAAQVEEVTKKEKKLSGKSSVSRPSARYPWKARIVTTVFWIGEQPAGHNLVPNRTSGWNKSSVQNRLSLDLPRATRGKHVS